MALPTLPLGLGTAGVASPNWGAESRSEPAQKGVLPGRLPRLVQDSPPLRKAGQAASRGWAGGMGQRW